MENCLLTSTTRRALLYIKSRSDNVRIRKRRRRNEVLISLYDACQKEELNAQLRDLVQSSLVRHDKYYELQLCKDKSTPNVPHLIACITIPSAFHFTVLLQLFYIDGITWNMALEYWLFWSVF